MGRRPIALVAHPGSELYGSDRVVLETVDALVGAGWDVTATVPEPGPLITLIEQRGARVALCPAPVVRKSSATPRGALELLATAARGAIAGSRLIRAVGPDVILVNTLIIPLWLVLARLHGRALVSHVHEAEGSASAPLRWLLAAPQLLSDVLVVNSRFSASVLADSFQLLGRRAVVVLNPVSGPSGSPAPARGNLDGAIRCVYVGRLSARKGVDVAVSAVTALTEAGVEAELDVVGDVFAGYEWYGSALRRQVDAAGLTDRVRLHGFHDDVWPFIAGSDVVLVPSRVDEPFGNTAVEGVLAARPTVVSDTSGLREAGADYEAVVRVPPGDPDALALAIARIRDDWPSYRDAAQRDSVRAGTRHSRARYAEQITALVGLAVDTHRRVPRRHPVGAL